MYITKDKISVKVSFDFISEKLKITVIEIELNHQGEKMFASSQHTMKDRKKERKKYIEHQQLEQ